MPLLCSFPFRSLSTPPLSLLPFQRLPPSSPAWDAPLQSAERRCLHGAPGEGVSGDTPPSPLTVLTLLHWHGGAGPAPLRRHPSRRVALLPTPRATSSGSPSQRSLTPVQLAEEALLRRTRALHGAAASRREHLRDGVCVPRALPDEPAGGSPRLEVVSRRHRVSPLPALATRFPPDAPPHPLRLPWVPPRSTILGAGSWTARRWSRALPSLEKAPRAACSTADTPRNWHEHA